MGRGSRGALTIYFDLQVSKFYLDTATVLYYVYYVCIFFAIKQLACHPLTTVTGRVSEIAVLN